jgi:hypothetical protein
MRPSSRWAFAAVVAWTATGSMLTAQAQAPSFAGTWRWNRAQSTVAPGEPVPSDVVLAIAHAEAARVQWTLTRTDDKGEKFVESYSGTGDGRPAPITGAPPGTTARFTVTPTSVASSYANSDGSSENATCTLSPDGRVMTCAGIDDDGTGHTRNYRDVFDRQ